MGLTSSPPCDDALLSIGEIKYGTLGQSSLGSQPRVDIKIFNT